MFIPFINNYVYLFHSPPHLNSGISICSYIRPRVFT
nr:MAG TPA: hypothetical protein [Caudoviricetes sp.]